MLEEVELLLLLGGGATLTSLRLSGNCWLKPSTRLSRDLELETGGRPVPPNSSGNSSVSNPSNKESFSANGSKVWILSGNSWLSEEVFVWFEAVAFLEEPPKKFGKGVSDEVNDLITNRVYIPMNDKCESLNVGVATSIILYEFGRK